MSEGILYDATMCIGWQCEQACATENGLPCDDTIAPQNVTSAHKYTTVLTKDELRRSGLRFGLSSGRSEEERHRPRYLRQTQMHWLPLLHGGTPL